MTYDTLAVADAYDSSEYIAPNYADLAVTDDISDWRRQANRLTDLLQVMPAGVVVVDGHGIVRQSNQLARDLLGEPLEGQVWRSVIARAFRPQADDGHEVSLTNGRLVKLSITPLNSEPGQLILLTDLTETRALQARISHMQRLSSLGRMVASLAHQIRTPLSAAMLHAANLTRKGLGEPMRIRFANKVVERLQALEHQVNDMLLFAKSGEQQVVEVISAVGLVDEIQVTAETLALRAEQQFHLQAFDDCRLLGNSVALKGALLNLIENAIQANPTGGRVQVSATSDRTHWYVSVCDEGNGVAEDNIDRLTEPFFTTKEQGTGLGLAVVKAVATAHQGHLIIENLVDGGACFTLCLPLAMTEVGDVA